MYYLSIQLLLKETILLNFKNLCTFNPPNIIAIILSCWKKKLLKRKIMLEKKKWLFEKHWKLKKKRKETPLLDLMEKNIPFYPKTLLLKSFFDTHSHTYCTHLLDHHIYNTKTFTKIRLKYRNWSWSWDLKKGVFICSFLRVLPLKWLFFQKQFREIRLRRDSEILEFCECTVLRFALISSGLGKNSICQWKTNAIGAAGIWTRVAGLPVGHSSSRPRILTYQHYYKNNR